MQRWGIIAVAKQAEMEALTGVLLVELLGAGDLVDLLIVLQMGLPHTAWDICMRHGLDNTHYVHNPMMVFG
jgi:hypothetical protein